jgi:hypothetical protein
VTIVTAKEASMKKTVFMLASVTTLTGFVSLLTAAGCSDAAPVQEAPDAAPDVKPPKEGGGPIVEPDAEPPPPTTCLTADAIDAKQFPYAKAAVVPGACLTTELESLSTFFATKLDAKEPVLVDDWAASVSSKCAECVFSESTDGEGSPLVTKDNKLLDVNVGGCIEIVSGNEACGRTYQQATDCRFAACATDCKTQEEFDVCYRDVKSIFAGPCKGAITTLQEECGSKLGEYETRCQGKDWTFEKPIELQCVTGGTADGG